MKNTFGQTLKQLRRSQSVSQRELAEKSGIDFTYISKLENDRLPPPSAETILRISEVLKVPSEVLLSQSGKVTDEIKTAVSNPEALKFLNEVIEMQLTNDEWKLLSAELKKLR